MLHLTEIVSKQTWRWYIPVQRTLSSAGTLLLFWRTWTTATPRTTMAIMGLWSSSTTVRTFSRPISSASALTIYENKEKKKISIQCVLMCLCMCMCVCLSINRFKWQKFNKNHTNFHFISHHIENRLWINSLFHHKRVEIDWFSLSIGTQNVKHTLGAFRNWSDTLVSIDLPSAPIILFLFYFRRDKSQLITNQWNQIRKIHSYKWKFNGTE